LLLFDLGYRADAVQSINAKLGGVRVSGNAGRGLLWVVGVDFQPNVYLYSNPHASPFSIRSFASLIRSQY
jgi:hypothetical protein